MPVASLDGLAVSRVEPAALVERGGEHVLERRRRARDQLLRLSQPLRVGNRRDRSLKLVVGVGAVDHGA